MEINLMRGEMFDDTATNRFVEDERDERSGAC